MAHYLYSVIHLIIELFIIIHYLEFFVSEHTQVDRKADQRYCDQERADTSQHSDRSLTLVVSGLQFYPLFRIAKDWRGWIDALICRVVTRAEELEGVPALIHANIQLDGSPYLRIPQQQLHYGWQVQMDRSFVVKYENQRIDAHQEEDAGQHVEPEQRGHSPPALADQKLDDVVNRKA